MGRQPKDTIWSWWRHGTVNIGPSTYRSEKSNQQISTSSSLCISSIHRDTVNPCTLPFREYKPTIELLEQMQRDDLHFAYVLSTEASWFHGIRNFNILILQCPGQLAHLIYPTQYSLEILWRSSRTSTSRQEGDIFKIKCVVPVRRTAIHIYSPLRSSNHPSEFSPRWRDNM